MKSGVKYMNKMNSLTRNQKKRKQTNRNSGAEKFNELP